MRRGTGSGLWICDFVVGSLDGAATTLDHAGAVWHVTSRGNERREIFRDYEDRERFLTTLGRVVQTFRWRVHAYVLMGNHYHLLVESRSRPSSEACGKRWGQP